MGLFRFFLAGRILDDAEQLERGRQAAWDRRHPKAAKKRDLAAALKRERQRKKATIWAVATAPATWAGWEVVYYYREHIDRKILAALVILLFIMTVVSLVSLVWLKVSWAGPSSEEVRARNYGDVDEAE